MATSCSNYNNETRRRIFREINALAGIGPNTAAKIKCRLDGRPLQGLDVADDDHWRRDRIIISVFLLPNDSIYGQGSIPVNIILGPNYPTDPPQVVVKKPIYHPNVDTDGTVLCASLKTKGGYAPVFTLTKIIEEVTKIIERPDPAYPAHAEAASNYTSNRPEYDRQAQETFRNNFTPRN